MTATLERPITLPEVGECCVTCGRPIDTPFCGHCGERRASDRVYSLLHFSRENFIDSVASVDGRLLRSLRLLVTKPGELTARYMDGIRVPLLAPLQLFLILNVLFFVWSSARRIPIYDTPLTIQLHSNTPYRLLAQRLVDSRLAATHQDMASFERAFNAIGGAQARSLVLIMAPAFALFAGLASVGLRRRRYAVQHVVFSLHYLAFTFVLLPASLLATLAVLWIAGLAHRGFSDQQATVLWTAFINVGLAVYFALAYRRAYHAAWLRSLVAGAVAPAAMLVVLVAYRAALFFVTFYSM